MATVEPQTVVIVLLLIGVFIVAYKILKMLFETAFVTVISAAFYFLLAKIVDLPAGTDQILTFAFLGATLYMIFSVASTTFKGISKIFGFIGSLLSPIVDFLTPDRSKEKKRLKKMENRLKNYEKKLKDLRKNDSKGDESSDGSDEDSSVKEVILDNQEDD